jgi:NAD(P)-dependent dehydrogenase (short-subunit alcohol dehydrogenase family)
MNVVIADIEEEALEKAVRELEQRQVRALGVVTNTMRKESVGALLERTVEEFGKAHLLCNNAGVATATRAGKAVWELPDSDWEWILGVNFYGVLHGLQVFVPHMLEHGEQSHIVNTASLAGVLPGGGPYGVSKHGVLALTEGLQRDLSVRGANVNASVLCPGMVRTQIFKAERNRPDEDATEHGEPDQAARQMMAAMQNMLDRGKDPAEIADIVFDSISENRFYILPHPAWDEFVQDRVEKILARGPVAVTDMESLLKRQAAGEQF